MYLSEETAKERQSRVMCQKFEQPECRVCGKTLEVVYENECWTYTFDMRTGKYEGNLVDVEIRCPYCNAKLGRQFPEGVCNYENSCLTLYA